MPPGVAVAHRLTDRHDDAVTERRVTYRLPSNGFRPGGAAMLAGTVGPFHAMLNADGADAWLGQERGLRMTWHAGWSVRFDRMQLITPDGEVFAEEGDMLSAGGGYGVDGENEWVIESLSNGDPFIERVIHANEQRRRCHPDKAD